MPVALPLRISILPSSNPFGLSNVSNGRSSPDFADLDGDGDLDLLVGGANGGQKYFENTGSLSSPAFAPGILDAFGLNDVGKNANPTFADLNSNGLYDVYIGNKDADTSFFENITIHDGGQIDVSTMVVNCLQLDQSASPHPSTNSMTPAPLMVIPPNPVMRTQPPSQARSPSPIPLTALQTPASPSAPMPQTVPLKLMSPLASGPTHQMQTSTAMTPSPFKSPTTTTTTKHKSSP